MSRVRRRVGAEADGDVLVRHHAESLRCQRLRTFERVLRINLGQQTKPCADAAHRWLADGNQVCGDGQHTERLFPERNLVTFLDVVACAFLQLVQFVGDAPAQAANLEGDGLRLALQNRK